MSEEQAAVEAVEPDAVEVVAEVEAEAPTPDPDFDESYDGVDEATGQTYRELATAQGWRENHDGPVNKSPQEFFEFGKQIQSHLKSDKDAMKAERDAFKVQTENLNKMLETQRKVFKQQADRDLAQINAQINTAVESGDINAVNHLRKQADDIQSEANPQNVQPGPDPVLTAWKQDNDSWFNHPDHGFETTAAGAYADSLISANPTLTASQITAQVDAKMKTSFPHLYEEAAPATPRPKAPAVEGRPQRVGRKTKAKGANDLPPDARAMAERDVLAGTLKSVDDYAKLYFENDKD